ncbi:MAG: Cell division protein SepF [Syntrophomonadaceae bacterium]|nr:Cell division protein SepF [Bacillota bacterium]
MAKLWEKTLSFLGLVEETEEEEVLSQAELARTPARKGAVLNLHSGKGNNGRGMRLIIAKPREFAEAQLIVEHIKTRKPVLVNLEGTEHNEARRIIDFLSGATFALDGNMQKVSQQIFVFAPAQVEVNATQQPEAAERALARREE